MTLIRRSPIHTLNELENLITLLRSNIQRRREALTIAEVLEDIFINIYLPDNRLLSNITQQANTKQAAALAFVEETVKRLYGSFIDLLQVCSKECHDK